MAVAAILRPVAPGARSTRSGGEFPPLPAPRGGDRQGPFRPWNPSRTALLSSAHDGFPLCLHDPLAHPDIFGCKCL